MSGHSKWHNIQKTKGAQDAKRAAAFTKIAKELIVAVKEGGSADPAYNSRLATVITKAKAANMPNDNINRSIQKAAGEGSAANYKELNYEGYAPGGVAVILDVVTDNLNRTASEVRHLFDKHGGQLGASGCVSWMFDKKGLIVVERSASIDEDELMMEALDAGAEDFNALDDVYEIYTAPTDFSVVREALEAKGLSFLSAEIGMFPQNTVDATKDEELVEKIEKMLERFDDDDDVQDVYHNATLPKEEEEE